MNHESLTSILSSLAIPPSSQKIYSYLLEHKEATARELSQKLSITRPSTYDHLHILIKKSLVVEKKVEGKTFFLVDDVRHIQQSLESQIEDLSHKKDVFTHLLPSLLSTTGGGMPRITFHEGREGLRRVLYDMLWHSKGTLYTLWPYEEMLNVLGKDVLLDFNKRRIREKIHIHSLNVYKKIRQASIWQGADDFVVKRIVPKECSSLMGYTIYDDKVSFISSSEEVFGFIVQSKDFSNLMKMHFDLLWKISKKSS